MIIEGQAHSLGELVTEAERINWTESLLAAAYFAVSEHLPADRLALDETLLKPPESPVFDDRCPTATRSGTSRIDRTPPAPIGAASEGELPFVRVVGPAAQLDIVRRRLTTEAVGFHVMEFE